MLNALIQMINRLVHSAFLVLVQLHIHTIDLVQDNMHVLQTRSIRRLRYKKYLQYIANRHGWDNPRHVAKNRASLHEVGRAYNDREIMPLCV